MGNICTYKHFFFGEWQWVKKTSKSKHTVATLEKKIIYHEITAPHNICSYVYYKDYLLPPIIGRTGRWAGMERETEKKTQSGNSKNEGSVGALWEEDMLLPLSPLSTFNMQVKLTQQHCAFWGLSVNYTGHLFNRGSWDFSTDVCFGGWRSLPLHQNSLDLEHLYQPFNMTHSAEFN